MNVKRSLFVVKIKLFKSTILLVILKQFYWLICELINNMNLFRIILYKYKNYCSSFKEYTFLKFLAETDEVNSSIKVCSLVTISADY